MSTLYRIACAPTQKPYRIGLLFTKGSLISARFLQRSDAAPLRSWKWIVTYRIGFRTTLWHRVNRFPTAPEVKNSEGGFHNICVDFCYPKRCIQFTALYHEFNCFESPEKLKTLKDANASIGRKKSCCHSLLSCRWRAYEKGSQCFISRLLGPQYIKHILRQ